MAHSPSIKLTAALTLSITSLCLPTATACWSIPCYAVDADPVDTIKVDASGTGVDEDKALRQALKNAVMQAVGTIVDAETILKNDDIIKDQVLTASNAIVTKVERIGKPRVEDGLMTIQIRATVEKRGLMARLQDAKVVAVAKVDGKVEFAKMVANLENEKDVSKVIEKCLEGFPVNVMKAEIVGKPEIAGKRGDKVVLRYTVEYSLDREKYAEWRKAVEPFFEKISPAKKIALEDISKKRAYLKDGSQGFSVSSDVLGLEDYYRGRAHSGGGYRPLESTTGLLVYAPESQKFNLYELPVAAMSGIASSSLQIATTHTELFVKNKLIKEGHTSILVSKNKISDTLLYPFIAPDFTALVRGGADHISLSMGKFGADGKGSLEKMISSLDATLSNVDVLDKLKKVKGTVGETCVVVGLMGQPCGYPSRHFFEKVKVQKELELSEEDAKSNFDLKEIITLHSPLTREEPEPVTECIRQK